VKESSFQRTGRVVKCVEGSNAVSRDRGRRTAHKGDRGWGWDANFFDYKNDGDEDLYISNGWLDGSYAGNQHKQFFSNDGGTF
jgi:hypothetical protein